MKNMQKKFKKNFGKKKKKKKKNNERENENPISKANEKIVGRCIVYHWSRRDLQVAQVIPI